MNGTNYFSDVMKKQMLQNALNDVDDFRNFHTVGQQTRNATTFEEYKALVHSAADAYGKKSGVKKCAAHNAYSHDIDVYDPVAYLYNGYDFDTDIDTINANAANTHEGMISSNHFHQMTPEGHKVCISLPPENRKLILEQDSSPTSTLTDSLGSAHGRASGHECGAFAQHRDKPCSKLHVSFPDPQVLVYYFHMDDSAFAVCAVA